MVQSTCDISLDGNQSRAATCHIASSHPPGLECSSVSLGVNTLQLGKHSHAILLTSKCASVTE